MQHWTGYLHRHSSGLLEYQHLALFVVSAVIRRKCARGDRHAFRGRVHIRGFCRRTPAEGRQIIKMGMPRLMVRITRSFMGSGTLLRAAFTRRIPFRRSAAGRGLPAGTAGWRLPPPDAPASPGSPPPAPPVEKSPPGVMPLPDGPSGLSPRPIMSPLPPMPPV